MKFIFRALIFLLINLPVNFIFSQGLELSFSEHHPFENDYKPISCFNYNSSHILFPLIFSVDNEGINVITLDFNTPTETVTITLSAERGVLIS